MVWTNIKMELAAFVRFDTVATWGSDADYRFNGVFGLLIQYLPMTSRCSTISS